MVTNYRFGYLDCFTKHNMLARRNVVSVFFQSISIFQRSLVRRSRGFRLKVRGERLKAGSFYRFALNCFYVVARGAGAIVVIVALAVLVALGAAEPRGGSRGQNRESSTAAVTRGFSVILGEYAEGTTDYGYSANHRRALNRRRGRWDTRDAERSPSLGLPEYYSG